MYDLKICPTNNPEIAIFHTHTVTSLEILFFALGCVTPWCVHIPEENWVFLNITSQNNSHTLNRLIQQLSLFFDIRKKLDLEKLVCKLSISVRLPETVDLLCPNPFENLVFWTRSQRGEIPELHNIPRNRSRSQKSIVNPSRFISGFTMNF